MQVSRLAGAVLGAASTPRLALLSTALMAALIAPTATLAADAGAMTGRQLYEKECMVCHGDPTAASGAQPFLALQQHQPTRLDQGGGIGTPVPPLAIAPPYGPHLRGIIGRAAGSIQGYKYSRAFTKSLQGMEWTEAALDVWVTDSQRWVPDSLMLYKQADAEIRRKIIDYLKSGH